MSGDSNSALGTAPAATPALVDFDRPVPLHELRYLAEDDEVTVGRPDTESYCVLPPDGAALLRQLGDGSTPREAAGWYSATYAETVDVQEFLEAMDEMGFIRHDTDGGSAPDDLRPVRWQRLGQLVFSVPATVGYLILTLAAFGSVLRHHDLFPSYSHIFFSPSLTVIEVVLFVAEVPLVLLHESFHALAGRRLGLHSRLGMGRRLNFVVFETTMDGLVSVPRQKRYLPFLAGMIADVLVMSVFLLIAQATRGPEGAQPLVGDLALALAFATLVRLVWQFYFYLRTDLYYVAISLLRCQQLHETARDMMANRLNGLLGRRDRLVDVSKWRSRDRAVARWYQWLMVLGYTFSIATFLLAGLPAAHRVLDIIVNRFRHHSSWSGQLDSALFVLLNLAQFALLVAVAQRDRGRRRNTISPVHVIS